MHRAINKIGLKKITAAHKLALRQLVEFRCQGCTNHEDKVGTLQAHRIRRKTEGGKYSPNNILMVCKICHKLRHENEPNMRRK